MQVIFLIYLQASKNHLFNQIETKAMEKDKEDLQIKKELF